MEKHKFNIEKEDSKFQRGHYDLVVFNPRFLQDQDYEFAKGQDYAKLKDELSKKLSEPAILLGIKFMLNRKPFTSGNDAENWCEAVIQDYEKLKASRKWKDPKTSMEYPFMDQYLMLAFNGADDGDHIDILKKHLGGKEGLQLIGATCLNQD